MGSSRESGRKSLSPQMKITRLKSTIEHALKCNEQYSEGDKVCNCKHLHCFEMKLALLHSNNCKGNCNQKLCPVLRNFCASCNNGQTRFCKQIRDLLKQRGLDHLRTPKTSKINDRVSLPKRHRNKNIIVDAVSSLMDPEDVIAKNEEIEILANYLEIDAYNSSSTQEIYYHFIGKTLHLLNYKISIDDPFKSL